MNYKISIDYDDYFANSSIIKAKDIKVVGDSIMFDTDKETITLLDNKNIRYMLHESKKEKLKINIKSKSGIIIGFLCVCFLIFFNSFRVSKIEFNANYPINEEIKTYIEGQNQQLLFFSFHKNNYQDLSKDLRSVFNEYEWINIKKKGSVIYVEIEPTTTKNVTEDDELVADIIAKKSGVINSFAIFNGSSTLSINQYVEKGEVLISGQASKAKGYVLATIYEQKDITVYKNSKTNTLTGNVINYNQISLFGKNINIGKDTNYKMSNIVTKNIFSIPYLFNINKIEEYEKNDIIYVYDKKAAITYAASVIEDEFINSKVLNEEKILRLEELVVKEDEDKFIITFLIKKIESIGEIKRNI